MTIDLDRLEAVAKAATPGPWNVCNGFTVETCPDEKGYTTAVVDGYVWAPAVSVKDATFIAAANPAVVLEMIAEIRELQKKVKKECFIQEVEEEPDFTDRDTWGITREPSYDDD